MVTNKKQLVDWFRIIVDLERHGYGHAAQATAIETAKSTLTGWKNGSRPAYDEGERLVLLWCSVTGNDRMDVPKSSPYDFRR